MLRDASIVRRWLVSDDSGGDLRLPGYRGTGWPGKSSTTRMVALFMHRAKLGKWWAPSPASRPRRAPPPLLRTLNCEV